MATTTTASPSSKAPTSWNNEISMTDSNGSSSPSPDLTSFSTPPDLTSFFDNFISGAEESVQDCHVKGRNRFKNHAGLSEQELKIVRAVNGVKDEKMKQLEEKNMKLETKNLQLSEWMENDSKEREDVLSQLQAAMIKINNLEQVSCPIH